MASVQLCEYENQTLEVFVLASPVFIPSLIFQYSGARGFLSPWREKREKEAARENLDANLTIMLR